MKFFLDDERFPPDNSGEWIIVRTHDEFFDAITEYGPPDFVSFDHDLGDEINGSGMTVAKALVEMDLDDQIIPEGFDFYVHSQNPIGTTNISKLLHRYLEFKNE